MVFRFSREDVFSNLNEYPIDSSFYFSILSEAVIFITLELHNKKFYKYYIFQLY